MARALAVVSGCSVVPETNAIKIIIDTCIVPTGTDTFAPFEGQLAATVTGTEGTAVLNAAVEAAVIQHGVETGITLTAANIRQTKFT